MSPGHARISERKRALVMGILNRTPDSFSDGGRFMDDLAAVRRIERLIEDGADIIDIGAESTRPGARAVPAAEQIARLGGVVREAARASRASGGQRRVIVSIDTTDVEVAARALDDGATMVNSVSLEPAAALGALCARYGAALVLMHCRGSMAAMPGFSMYDEAAYGDVVADVSRELCAAAQAAITAGIAREEVILDPGLGFAKNARQSLELCARLDELCALGFPILVGPSRKSFVARAEAELCGVAIAPPEARLGGSIAAALACVARGAAIVRAHDAAELRQALAVAEAIGAPPLSEVTMARRAREEGRSHA